MTEIHPPFSFEEPSLLAWIKMFYERYRGDAKFRKRFREDPPGTIDKRKRVATCIPQFASCGRLFPRPQVSAEPVDDQRGALVHMPVL